MVNNLKKAGLNINDAQKKYTDLSNQLAEAYEAKDKLMSSEDASVTDLKAAAEKVETLQAKVGIAKSDYETAKNSLDDENKIPVDDKGNPAGNPDNSQKAVFGSDIYNLARKNFGQIVNVATESDDDTLAVTIPVDQQTTINEIRKQRTDFSQEFHHESVGTLTGSRVVQTDTNLIPLQDLTDGETISLQDVNNLKTISYAVHTYATATKLTNNLLNDSKENLQAYVLKWIALSQVLGRSQVCLRALNQLFVDSVDKNGSTIKAPKSMLKITKLDDVLDLVLPGSVLDGAVTASSKAKIYVTNSGFLKLAKVKNNKGEYMLQPDVTNPSIYRFEGKEIKAVENSMFKDKEGNSLFTKLPKNAEPIIFGDLDYSGTVYDRMASRIDLDPSLAFLDNANVIRFIDRFDSKVMQPDGFAIGYFNNIADQVPMISTNTSSTDDNSGSK
ncbi:phage major capsid protein [Fructilactobacillus myrtifloralis]|uniref:Phage major capsid protein n=1 Tax=Fructilactobacillus myrtifloralis TaxID=2940301 RepID=A0ABY5BN26_9LACO|nr:phage major capsid protein [Fructilactobacillus myrtifloralis]USS85077.1 phage major capsid protein [Fructilactobacillus myrtifloralis]